jgi:excisionase family DNA binding protein
MNDKQLTISEAAKRLGVSRNTMRRLVDEGKVRGWRIPGSKHRRVPESEIVRLTEELPFSEAPF